MPTELIDQSTTGTYAGVTRVTSHRYRNRTWSVSASYGTVDRRDLPENPYSDLICNASQSPGVGTNTNYYTGAFISTQSVGYQSGSELRNCMLTAKASTDPLLTSVTQLKNEAFIKAASAVADAKTNLPVLFAEMSKTVRLITSTARRIYSAYRAFRRGRLGDVARLLGISPSQVHKTWLEYKYGWMPLLMDVKQSAEFIGQLVVGRAFEFTASGTAQATASKTSSPAGSAGHVSASTIRRVRIKLDCRIDNPRASTAQQLGLTNPALVVWELVPFSFVFDWFIQVGDYLKAVTAFHGVSVRKAMESSLDASSISGAIVDPAYAYPGLGVRYTGATAPLLGTVRSYQRGPYIVNLAQLYPPPNRDWFKLNRMITGLALMRARAGR